MGQRRVKLETLDNLIHYSLALYLGLPIVIFVGYFVSGQLGLFGIDPTIDENDCHNSRNHLRAVMFDCVFGSKRKVKISFHKSNFGQRRI